MRTIFKIAKTELRMLFCTPIAWFLLIVFIIQLSMIFTGIYKTFTFHNEWYEGRQFMPSFTFIMSMWNGVTGSIYYYIPLLTMGLISKELNSGSIKLLYSSPVTNTQLVLGKFLSTITFALSICALLAVYMTVAAFTIENFELAAALVGLLGIFLLTCTYIAIGLFMSSLTSYQFVAAIGTFVILMLLTVVGTFKQEYDVVRDITYWLSINGRTFTFIRGMLCSEDLLYFPTITAMFLGLTIIRLNAIRQRVSFGKTFARYAGVVLATCAVAYLSSRPMLISYYDATATKLNTLTAQSQEVVKKLDGKLKITGYANVLNEYYRNYAFPDFIIENREVFKLYERFKPDIKLKMIYYYDSITIADREKAGAAFEKMCKKEPGLTLEQRAALIADRDKVNPSIFKSPEYLAKRGVDLRGERTMVWVLELNGKKVLLRAYPEDIFNTTPKEAEISAAMKALTSDLHKIAIVKGRGMRTFSNNSMQNYYYVAGNKDARFSLINQGFEAFEVDIANPVPENVDVLMIADMYEPLTEQQNSNLKNYVDRGGNMFILAEQSRKAVMNPMLEEFFGVKLLDGTLVQYARNTINPMALNVIATPQAENLSFLFTGRAGRVSMPTVSGLTQVADKGFDYVPVLVTDSIDDRRSKRLKAKVKQQTFYPVWNEMESLDLDKGKISCNPKAGEFTGEYCTTVALSRKVGDKEQRIIVVGDADCLSSEELMQPRGQQNMAFSTAVFHYLSNNEMPFDTRRPPLKDTKVKITKEGNERLRTVLLFVLPLTFLAAALIIWLRRRSR